MADIALVLFVVPVVPDAAMTLHPKDCVLAMDVPPVPATGICFSAAAIKALLLIPVGSQERSIIPSIFPSSISFESSSSFSVAK